MEDYLEIAGKKFRSRLILGTGKYSSPEACVAALEASGTEIVTVAIRRLDLDDPKKRTELDYIDWARYTILPNTAGCQTADEALVNTAVAKAGNPTLMAEAMRMGVEAGRKAFLAGRVPKKAYASASSPLEGVVR